MRSALNYDEPQHKGLKAFEQLAIEIFSVQAFIYGPLSQAGKAEARRLQETVAEYLAPMLDIITAMPAIQVSQRCPRKCSWAPQASMPCHA